ncbi:MAG: ABC transporter ATP-binding protein [Proteobacteria bacterium]|nr:ABC transporter ATP-binding protein [Pseudomonadota bacterium]
MPALEIQALTKAYRGPNGTVQPVIDVPSLTLEQGEQMALRGRSGSGKTTLLHLIAGILRPDGGQIRIAGEDMAGASESARDRLRGRAIGYVFQTFHLLEAYSALENVLLAMHFGAGEDPERARELLARVGLEERLQHRPAQLSVGQRQRVAVARALANSPALVLADEPTGNLDPANASDALRLIREICAETGSALLLVSHDASVLAAFERCEELEALNAAAGGR